MDRSKAEDIINSLGVIEVLYQGSPVWIEELQGYTAQIKYLYDGKRQQVDVAELVEA